MSEDLRADDPRSVWKKQQIELPEVNMNLLLDRRTRELRWRTRTEIAVSIGAGLFFAFVAAQQFAITESYFEQVMVLIIFGWSLLSLFRYRSQLFSRPLAADAFAAAGVEHYRRELERRRDHLRSIWIWNGPALLAVLFMAVKVGPGLVSRPALLVKATPFLTLLAVWLVLLIRQRRQQAYELQEEIDELNRTEA